MKILVTGSSGHLGEALMRELPGLGHEVVGIDVLHSPFTTRVGSVTDAGFVGDVMRGVEVVLHTATLHKPHVATHPAQAFVDVNISGTLTLLEAAVANGVNAFVFSSTTSVFGRAMVPADDAPAQWVTEALQPIPRNIYGVTKLAAENLCELYWQRYQLPTVVLRLSRFFLEDDDDRTAREAFESDNLKLVEMLYRRVDIEDAVRANICAYERAAGLGFTRCIISATTPFEPDDTSALNGRAAEVVSRRSPGYERLFAARGWRMPNRIGRVYDNAHARRALGWAPAYSFESAVARLRAGCDYRSALSLAVGKKPYHAQTFEEGPYPVDP
ncbi:MAG: NAD(P)-dependent oxidoreductase [Pseudomonadota bacterium]